VQLIGNKNKKVLIKNKKKPSLVDRMVLNGKSKLKFSAFTFIIAFYVKDKHEWRIIYGRNE
jgi:hypothetical protein